MLSRALPSCVNCSKGFISTLQSRQQEHFISKYLLSKLFIEPRHQTVFSYQQCRFFKLSTKEGWSPSRNKVSVEPKPEPDKKTVKTETDREICKRKLLIRERKKVQKSEQSMKNISTILFQLLDLGEGQAKALVKKYAQFRSNELTIELVQSRISQLQALNIPKSRVARLPWLILLPTEELILRTKRASELLHLDFECAVAMAGYKPDKLLRVVHIWSREQLIEPELMNVQQSPNDKSSHQTRLHYLAEKLECSPTQVADMMGKCVRLSEIPFSGIPKIITLAFDIGVQPKDIVEDPWVFTYHIKTLERRAQILKDYNLTGVKPWMIRCTDSKFDQCMQRKVQENSLRCGHADLPSFLQKLLNCSKEETALIFFKVPAVKKATASKLNEMVQFLFERGYTSADILSVPRILGHSTETIEERMTNLRLFGVQDKEIRLTYLCGSIKDWALTKKRFDPSTSSKKRRKSKTKTPLDDYD